MSREDDQFYIKTTDGTVFCIYELTFTDESGIMSFGYAPVDTLSIDKEEYAEEIDHIVKTVVTNAITEHEAECR